MPSPAQLAKADQAWREEVFAKYELMYIQRFWGDAMIIPPPCDTCKTSRSIGMWRNRAGNGFCLCAKCSIGAEPPIAALRGEKEITYRPTQFPKAQQ